MKITLFISALSGGGVERSTVRLASQLIASGYQVDLVALSAAGRMSGEVPDGVRIFDLEARRLVRGFFPYLRYLWREQPDVIVAAMSGPNLISAMANGILSRRRPLVISQRGIEGVLYGRQKRVLHRILQRLMWLAYRRADAVVAVSEGVAKQLARIPRLDQRKIHVVYNPVWSKALSERASETADHPWFGEGENIPIIISVGRLSGEKGFDTLLRAFHLLCSTREARLIVIGEGAERKKLEEITSQLGLADSISFLGYKANPLPYMARSSVYVLASREEGFGNVLVEAMSCGLPVVSTDCPGGPAEILDRGRYGTLVPVDDPVLMAKAIEEMLDNPTEPDSLRARAREFSIEASANGYLQLIDKLRSNNGCFEPVSCA